VDEPAKRPSLEETHPQSTCYRHLDGQLQNPVTIYSVHELHTASTPWNKECPLPHSFLTASLSLIVLKRYCIDFTLSHVTLNHSTQQEVQTALAQRVYRLSGSVLNKQQLLNDQWINEWMKE
jgi:hypothetical protein